MQWRENFMLMMKDAVRGIQGYLWEHVADASWDSALGVQRVLCALRSGLLLVLFADVGARVVCRYSPLLQCGDNLRCSNDSHVHISVILHGPELQCLKEIGDSEEVEPRNQF